MTDKTLPITSAVLRLFKGVEFSDRTPNSYDDNEPDRVETTSLEDAEVVSSEIAGRPGCHLVLLDLDVPAHLVPSSTPGHSHLYIELPMSWERYEALLAALAAAGIVEPGYLQVSRKRRATHLRLPWVKKATAAPAAL
jgi:hypothetical protein